MNYISVGLPFPEQWQRWPWSTSPCWFGNPQMSPLVQVASLRPAEQRPKNASSYEWRRILSYLARWLKVHIECLVSRPSIITIAPGGKTSLRLQNKAVAINDIKVISHYPQNPLNVITAIKIKFTKWPNLAHASCSCPAELESTSDCNRRAEETTAFTTVFTNHAVTAKNLSSASFLLST